MRKHRHKVERQRRGVRTTRLRRPRVHRSSYRHNRVHRIPRPTSVTIAKRPSVQWRGTARFMDLIWVNREGIYFCGHGWTGSISLSGLSNSHFSRNRNWSRGGFGGSPNPRLMTNPSLDEASGASRDIIPRLSHVSDKPVQSVVSFFRHAGVETGRYLLSFDPGVSHSPVVPVD